MEMEAGKRRNQNAALPPPHQAPKAFTIDRSEIQRIETITFFDNQNSPTLPKPDHIHFTG